MAINGKQITALLPMKANSERVNSKNFRNIAGKPLFRWILDTLLTIDSIDKIVINTDARHILEQSGLSDLNNNKVIIRDRKDILCGDHVSMNLIIEDDINAIDSDYYFMTHTTNPLLSGSTIKKMISEYNLNKNIKQTDSLFCVSKHQTRFYDKNANPINHDPKELIRTQDLTPYFEENSCGYLFTNKSFSITKARIGKSPLLFETPPLESIDIDEPEDWYLAESLLMRNPDLS
jgi:CMP-N-acetylneuraminic acid synthetase